MSKDNLLLIALGLYLKDLRIEGIKNENPGSSWRITQEYYNEGWNDALDEVQSYIRKTINNV